MASQEFDAQRRLADVGLPAMVPTFRRQIKPRHTHGSRIVLYPLFARYLFVDAADLAHGLDRMRREPSVRPVRSDAGAPLVVPEADVASIARRAEAGEFDMVDELRFPVGAMVLVTIGTMVRNATVSHVLSHRRRRLDLDGSALSIVASVDLLAIRR